LKDKIINLSETPSFTNELNYINNYIKKNKLSQADHFVEGFENDIENYIGRNKKVACLNSATSAIHLSLILSGVGKNDEVIVQSATYVASVSPILYLNAKPVFIDSESETWNMCPILLEKAILARVSKGIKPKAIIVVHLYGMPAKMDEIIEIAKKYQIVLIEDAAEAFGSSYKGVKCGAFGDFGILSFNNNKIISTSGGGALICNSTEIKEKAIYYATQARDDVVHYEHSRIGYNYRMSNILAGIGRYQMKSLDAYILKRRKNNSFYQDLFKDIKGISVFKEFDKDFFSNHWLSCVLIDEKQMNFTSEELRLNLSKDYIEARLLWKPMHLQPIFKNYIYFGDKVAENIFNKGLCLPSGSDLTKKNRIRIANSIHKLL
jgi:dTDP-4-amino-4,6-dideoxygalactose transaminase